MKPDFTYLSLGAGVQSGTLAEMIVIGKLPPVDVAVFSDTGDEPQYVYDYVEYLRPRLDAVGVPLEIVTNGNMVKDATAADGRFAAMPVFTIQDGKVGRMRRQCTREYKVEPVERLVRSYLLDRDLATKTRNGAVRIRRGVGIEVWLGLSLDEVSRMKENRVPAITSRWPLIEMRMSRHDCKGWLKAHNLPTPNKSSCRVCPFHNDTYLRDMRDNHPGDWDHVVKFDAFLRSGDSRLVATAKGDLYLHRSCVPLDQVDLTTEQDNGQLELWDACDDGGHCFV